MISGYLMFLDILCVCILLCRSTVLWINWRSVNMREGYLGVNLEGGGEEKTLGRAVKLKHRFWWCEFAMEICKQSFKLICFNTTL